MVEGDTDVAVKRSPQLLQRRRQTTETCAPAETPRSLLLLLADYHLYPVGTKLPDAA